MTLMNFILDILVLLLLILVLFYCLKLNKSITLIHDTRKELLDLLNDFDSGILKAGNIITELKSVSSDVSGNLQQKIDKSVIIMDNLSFLHKKISTLIEDFNLKKVSSSKKDNVKLKEAEDIRNNLEVLMNKIAKNNAEKRKKTEEPLLKDDKDVLNLLKLLGYGSK